MTVVNWSITCNLQ